MLFETFLPVLQGLASPWSQQPLQSTSQISFHAFEPLLSGAAPITDSTTQLAAPKFIEGVNSTSGEQWAFDATSADGTSGLLIGIYHDPTYAFLGPGNLRVSIDAVWPNGTTFSHVDYLERADVSVDERGTSGRWYKSGGNCSYSFFVSSGNSEAVLEFESPRVKGKVEYQSTVLPRYPNGEQLPDSSTFNAPAVEWVEMMPGARADVSLELDGTPLTWGGMGGIERWWAGQGWLDAFQGWTAMRAVVGPYTLTYWAPTSKIVAGRLHPSAFLARNGKKIFSATRSGPSIQDSQEPYIEYRGISNGGKLMGMTGHTGSNKAGAVEGYIVTLVAPEENLRWEFVLTHKNMEFEFDLGDANGGVAYVGTARGGQIGDDVYEGVFFNEWVDVASLKVPKVYVLGASWYYRLKAVVFGF